MFTDADIMAQVLAAFRAEQAEHRQAAGEILLELERDPFHPQRKELLDQLFREAHSLKGGARAAGLLDVERMAHCIEDVFAAARDGRLELSPSVCDPIYAGLDAIGVLMARYDAGVSTDLAPYQPLLDTLAGTLNGATESSTVELTPNFLSDFVPNFVPDLAPNFVPDLVPDLLVETKPTPIQSRHNEDSATVRLPTSVLDSLLNEAGELMTCTLRAQEAAREATTLAELPARWRRTWRRIGPRIARLRAAPAVMRPIVHHPGLSDESTPIPANVAWQPRDLIEALEQANDLLGDIGATMTRIARQAAEDHSRLAAVTDRLHDQVRRTRMQPLATLFPPLRLQLREIARNAGKRIELTVDDGGAEADRQVLDQLREVLLHLLRNAADHGVEMPALRGAAGKPEVGIVTINAEVSGDHLSIQLSDDGAGIDLTAVRARAVSAGLIADVDQASEADLLDMIFLPGFSTRRTVSEISGRGVGLDVVRTLVERMRGHVSVRNHPGMGADFLINVPISLARSHGLLLRAADTVYVLPLDAIQRIVAISPAQIHHLEGRPVLRIDDRPMPVVSLVDLLGMAQSTANSSGIVLILGSGERQVACQIDAVLGEQELVIHRLPAPLVRVHFVSGATILANGQVVPILDVVDLVRAAAGVHRTPPPAPKNEDERRIPTILVADDSITTRTLEKNILEAAGYRVRLATDGQEAIDLLRSMSDNGGCDLLLSDIDMPRLNGFDLTRQVRGDAKLRHLPVVLVTSLDSAGDRERGVAAGADAYIIKRAFDQQALLDIISRLV
jgi:two-component system, chemotaxis family, sensor kinase CheA